LRLIDGINTTLGRGGSDYTAAILAGALDAAELEIWTTECIYCQPKIVKQSTTYRLFRIKRQWNYLILVPKLYPPTTSPFCEKHSNNNQNFRGQRYIYIK
jgi:aspartokinase/homoserine dehydrogenase 1